MHHDPSAVVVPQHQRELAVPLRRCTLGSGAGTPPTAAATTHGKRLSCTGGDT